VEVFAGPTLASMTSRGTVTLDAATGLPSYHGEDYAVAYPGVRYIQFDIQSNLDGAVFDGTGAQGGADGRHLTGLSEVRFGGSPAGQMTVAPWVAQVSSQNPFNLDRLAVHTVDGSGMSGIGEAGDAHNNFSEGVVWTTMGNLPPGPSDFDPFVTYDLGGVLDVKTMRIWNNNQAGFSHLGVGSMEVFAGPTLASLTSEGVFDLLQATELSDYAGQDIDVAFDGVRYIMFDILTNLDGAVFDGTGTQGGRDGRFLAGLSEVRFTVEPDVIPEPATVALLAGGLLALVRRRSGRR